MLRSSHKALTLHLSPRGFALSDSGVPLPELVPWQGAARPGDARGMGSLIGELPVPTTPGKQSLDVVLDNAWARLQLVRFPHGVRTPEERDVFVRASFRHVFGSQADGWRVVVDRNPLHLPSLAMAVDAPLFQAVSDFAEQHELRLRSMQAAFVTVFNRLRVHLSAHHGGLAHVDSGRVCLGLWQQRRWVAIRSQPLGEGDGIGALLRQMLAGMDAGYPEGTLYVKGGRQGAALDLPAGWTVHWMSEGGG